MKNLFLLFFLISFTLALNAQTVMLTLEKEVYKLNEQIKFSQTIDFKPDSIHRTDLEDFKIIGGPFSKSTTNYIEGKFSTQQVLNYVLKAKTSGKKMLVPIPIF